MLTVTHDLYAVNYYMANGTAVEGVDHMLEQVGRRLEREIIAIKGDHVGQGACFQHASMDAERRRAAPCAHGIDLLGAEYAAVGGGHLLEQRGHTHFLDHTDTVITAAAIAAKGDASTR